MLADSVALADEDEGEAFDFDDSDEDIPEANCPPPSPPAPLTPSSKDQSHDRMAVSHPDGHTNNPQPPFTISTTSRSSTGGPTEEGEGTSAVEGTDDGDTDLPPPPPPIFEDTETDPRQSGLLPKNDHI